MRIITQIIRYLCAMSLIVVVSFGVSLSAQAEISTVDWVRLSSDTGDLPTPPDNEGQVGLRVIDLDQDGRMDYVLTLRNSPEPVVWYRQNDSGFEKYIIDWDAQDLSHGERFQDIDKDGDIDLLFGGTAIDNNGGAVYWWENPYPNFAPNTPWERRTLYATDDAFFHDNIWGDFDSDGIDELIIWNQRKKHLLQLEIPVNPRSAGMWPVTEIFNWRGNGDKKKYKGADAIDINLDGELDFIGGCGWFERTGGTNFIRHPIDDAKGYSAVKAGQLVAGGRPEIICLVELDGGPLNMYEWNGSQWVARTLISYVPSSHSMQLGDINRDGHMDVMVGELVNDNGRKLYALYGDGEGNFVQQVISEGYEHIEGQLEDIDGDGNLDIISQPHKVGNPRIDMWINQGAGPTLTVPGVVGLSQTEAEAAITGAGLTVGTVSTVNSDTVPAGNVISQDPSSGVSVASGAAVDLVVSLGAVPTATVPSLVGLTQSVAEDALVAAGLIVGAVTSANSDTIAAGAVITQNPVAGATAGIGSAVDLVVSLGPVVTVVVPDVLGLSQAAAEASLVGAGLVVGTVSTASSDTVPAGDVISQTPGGGASVPGGSAVDLLVSLGVTTGLYQEDFNSYTAGANPGEWFDTAADNSLVADDSLFEVFDLGGNKVLGTSSTAKNIHSHFTGGALAGATGYEFSGQLQVTASGGGIGVTFFSQYPTADAYYRLRRYGSSGSFHLSSHGTSVTGTTDSGVVPAANQWYRFRIQVEDTGSQTEIKANVWPQGTTEPTGWQINAVDASATRLTSGAIGVWGYRKGNKYWDDLMVTSISVSAIIVPSLVGLTQSVAEDALVAAGLIVGAVTSANSDTIAAGAVITQNPVAGATAGIGSAVDLVVSLGPVVTVVVPDVLGLSQAAAEASLVGAGLVVGTVSTASSDTVPAGDVISQTPGGGASVPGGSAVDLLVSLGVTTGLYQEDFNSYTAGANPGEWFDTAADNSLVADDSLFEVFDLGGNKVLGTSSTAKNIHSHFTGGALAGATGYEFSGQLQVTASGGGIGVTFFSQYPTADAYYRLRRYGSSGSFHLSSHGTSVTGTTDSGVVPAANQWYRFRIQVEDTGSQTEIKANVWPQGTTEPTGWQINAVDASATRLTSGAIGVWGYRKGNKYWDDLLVR